MSNQILGFDCSDSMSPHPKDGFIAKRAEDDDGDDENDLSLLALSGLAGKSVFKGIADSLYKADYERRIISISEDIDERCFIYAKMIEDWNRYDREILAIRQEIKENMEKDENFKMKISPYIDDPYYQGPEADLDDASESEEAAEEEAKEIVHLMFPIMVRHQGISESLYTIMHYEPKPIKIKFNSHGGLLRGYQTLADTITLSATPVIGINMGLAASAAAFLLVACHERYAMPRSRMVVHRGSGGFYGTYEQTDAGQADYKAQVDEMIDSFIKRTKVSEKDLKDKMNPDWYFSAEEALQYGLVDYVVTNISDLL